MVQRFLFTKYTETHLAFEDCHNRKGKQLNEIVKTHVKIMTHDSKMGIAVFVRKRSHYIIQTITFNI